MKVEEMQGVEPVLTAKLYRNADGLAGCCFDTPQDATSAVNAVILALGLVNEAAEALGVEFDSALDIMSLYHKTANMERRYTDNPDEEILQDFGADIPDLKA
jgi:hypothetical protein